MCIMCLTSGRGKINRTEMAKLEEQLRLHRAVLCLFCPRVSEGFIQFSIITGCSSIYIYRREIVEVPLNFFPYYMGEIIGEQPVIV